MSIRRWAPLDFPAGYAFEKDPPTKTVPPTISCVQTTPFVCTVGSASADTVVGVLVEAGAVSATEAGAASSRVERAAVVASSATASRRGGVPTDAPSGRGSADRRG